MFDSSRSVSKLPAEESGQSRARAGRKVEPADRHLHRSGRDVDDAAEFLLRHRIDDFLDQLDRDHHIGGHAVEHLLPVDLAEVAKRRAGIVVHQNVRLRHRGKQRLLPFRRRDVSDHGDHFRAGRLGDLGRRAFGPRFVAPIDHDLAAGFGEPMRARAAEPAARCADDGLAARDAEIHERRS
jgi:hypothetical protein